MNLGVKNKVIDILFVVLCILIMWPMLFSVPILYGSSSKETSISETLTMTSVGLFTAFMAWMLFGYVLTFGIESSFFSSIDSYFSNLQQGDGPVILNMVLQACFFLYAAGMFIGTLIHKVDWKFFTVFIPIWLLVVYVPIAFSFWNTNGFLNQLGALDFSGGLVVHITAGVTSLLLAHQFTDDPLEVQERSSDLPVNYIATTLICFGWFGFNLGPLGTVNELTGLVILNTILAIIGGSSGYLLLQWKSVVSEDLLTGMMVGLVTSTALVGYASPLAVLFTSIISGLITCYYRNQSLINDPVDSFILNGIGGIIGTFGLMLFANPIFTPNGQTGLVSGGNLTNFPLIELLGLAFTLLISLIGAQFSISLTKLILFRKKEIVYEN